MSEVKRFSAFGLAVITSMFGLVLAAQSGDPAAIQQALNSQIKLTTTTGDRSEIATAGTIVEVHREGMMIYGFMSPLPPSNTYKNGKIVQGWGGFGKDLAITMLAPGGATSANYPQARFASGDKCWVTGLKVQKDGVGFQLYSDPVNDIRYYGNLKIPFPNKKEVPSVDAALQMVAEVLTVVPSQEQQASDAGSQQVPTPVSAQNGQQTLAPGNSFLTPAVAPGGASEMVLPPPTAAAQRQYQDLAPPPPPPAPAPSISIGQTKDQVIAAFGEPQRKAAVGPKVIFFYTDIKMKVTFIGGKVSSID